MIVIYFPPPPDISDLIEYLPARLVGIDVNDDIAFSS